MKMRSRFSWPLRAVIVVVGAVVILAGSVGRAIEQEYPSAEGAADEVGVLEDGSWVAYHLIDSGSGFEVDPTDATTFVVYEIPNESDARIEVYRGTEDDAHEFMRSTTRLIVFDGSRSEVLAWQRAEREGAREMLLPNATIIVGCVFIALGLLGGWSRKSESPAARTTIPGSW